jgi:hypothetical protein
VINLRYHIVSITAVFLALGIGITLGSTFIGRETLNRIDQNVKAARAERDRVRAENADLRRQLNALQSRGENLTAEGVKRLFARNLEDIPTLVIAAPGVDGDSLHALTEALSDSASTFLGTLTVDDKVQLKGGAADDLAQALGATTREPGQLRRLATARLAREMEQAARPGTDGPEPPQTSLPETDVTVIGSLLDADFLKYEASDTDVQPGALLTGQGYRYVIVTGSGSDVPDSTFLLPLVRALTDDHPAPVVVASAATGDDPEQDRPVALAPYVDDDTIHDRISSVDDLEDFSGVAAVMLSLSDLGIDQRGHYGYGNGRTLLPTDSS